MKRFPSVKKHLEYQTIYKNGTSLSTRNMVMYVMKNDLEYNRLGMSVSKRVGNSVVRHTVMRRFREIFRLNNNHAVQGYDIILVARNGVFRAPYEKLDEDYRKLLQSHNIWIEN